MPDITTVWDAVNFRGDWAQAGAVLLAGSDLDTAIALSLFLDRQAESGDAIPDGSANLRGWWGNPNLGSRLWLLRRAKQTDETLRLAYDYIAEALQWLLEDGVVGRFDINVQWVRSGVLGALIVAYLPDGTVTKHRFAWAWEGIS